MEIKSLKENIKVSNTIFDIVLRNIDRTDTVFGNEISCSVFISSTNSRMLELLRKTIKNVAKSVFDDSDNQCMSYGNILSYIVPYKKTRQDILEEYDIDNISGTISNTSDLKLLKNDVWELSFEYTMCFSDNAQTIMNNIIFFINLTITDYFTE